MKLNVCATQQHIEMNMKLGLMTGKIFMFNWLSYKIYDLYLVEQ